MGFHLFVPADYLVPSNPKIVRHNISISLHLACRTRVRRRRFCILLCSLLIGEPTSDVYVPSLPGLSVVFGIATVSLRLAGRRPSLKNNYFRNMERSLGSHPLKRAPYILIVQRARPILFFLLRHFRWLLFPPAALMSCTHDFTYHVFLTGAVCGDAPSACFLCHLRSR